MKEIQREIRSFRTFASDSQNRKTMILIVAVVILIAATGMVKDIIFTNGYISGNNGTVKGVIRDSENESASFPLKVEADVAGEKESRDVMLTIDPVREEDEKAERSDKSEKSLFESELAELVSKLSKSGGRKIMLPTALSDGTGLIWKKGNDMTWPFLLLLAPALIWMLYMDGERKKRDSKKKKTDSVERELPAFNDQLLLLLGSGLIFREAFRRIADGYRQKAGNSYFQSVIIGIEDETEQGVSDIVNVITRRAEEIGVSEFSRLAGVIQDNQLMGTDISDKLRNEGEILWDLRKRNAEERGRLAETKLTLPLAILLMVLVLVTAAPAMIQVQGG